MVLNPTQLLMTTKSLCPVKPQAKSSRRKLGDLDVKGAGAPGVLGCCVPKLWLGAKPGWHCRVHTILLLNNEGAQLAISYRNPEARSPQPSPVTSGCVMKTISNANSWTARRPCSFQMANLPRTYGLWNAQGQGQALVWYLEKPLTQRTELQWALVEVEVRRKRW